MEGIDGNLKQDMFLGMQSIWDDVEFVISVVHFELQGLMLWTHHLVVFMSDKTLGALEGREMLSPLTLQSPSYLIISHSFLSVLYLLTLESKRRCDVLMFCVNDEQQHTSDLFSQFI